MAPTVPIYDSPQVHPNNLPVQYNSPIGPAAFGAGLGEGLQSAGAQLDAAYKKERSRQDLARVQDAQSLLGQWRTDNLYDAKKGYFAKKGKDAFGQSDKYLADYDSLVEAISSNLSTEEQRHAFGVEASAQRQQVADKMSGYELQQADALADASYKAVLSSSVSDAANDYTDPVSIAHARHIGLFAVLARGKAEGWSTEVVDAQMRSFTTGMHLSVVDRMLAAGDGLGAQKYLKLHGAEIDGAQRAQVDRQAQVAGLAQRGLAEARRIQSETPDVSKQLEAVKDIPNAELQDAAAARLNHDAAEAERARDLADAQRLGRTVQLIEQGDPTWRYRADFEQMADDKKAMAMERAAAIARQWRAQHSEDRRLAAEARREQREANQLAVQQLLGLPVDQQATVELKGNFPGVDALGLAELGAHQRRAKDDVQKLLVPDRTQFDDRVKQMNADAGLDPSAVSAKTNLAYMHAWRERWYAEHGGKGPTRQDVEEALAAKLLQVKVEDTGFLSDDKTSLLEARGNPKYAGKTLAPQWTDEQLAAARAAFSGRGKEASDEQLENWLRAKYGLPLQSPEPAPEEPGPAPANTTSQPAETPTRGGSF